MRERERSEGERPERKRAGPVEGEREQRERLVCVREIRERDQRERESRASRE